MMVRDQALRLERRHDRAPQCLGEGDHSLHVEAGAVTHDDGRSLRRLEELQRLVHRLGWRGDRASRQTTLRTPCLRPGVDGQRLHVVGEDEVRDTTIQDGGLAGQVGQFGVFAGREDGLGPLSDLAVRGHEVDFLEGPRSQNLAVDLAGEREDRRAVDVRIPKAGEQVGGARTRNGEAGGRSAGQLAVRAGGERRCSFVADAIVAEGAGGLLSPHRIGQAQVGVSDHSPYMADSPVDHRLDDHVGDRAWAGGLLGEPDVDTVLAHLDRIGRDAVVIPSGRFARSGVEVPAVPGAP